MANLPLSQSQPQWLMQLEREIDRWLVMVLWGGTLENPGAKWEQQVHDSKWARISRRWGVCWPWVSCLKVCVPSTVDLLYSEQDLHPSPEFCLLWPQSTKFCFFKDEDNQTCTLTWFSFSSIASILAILGEVSKVTFRELRSSSQLGETSDYLGLAFCLAEQTLSAPSLGPKNG